MDINLSIEWSESREGRKGRLFIMIMETCNIIENINKLVAHLIKQKEIIIVGYVKANFISIHQKINLRH